MRDEFCYRGYVISSKEGRYCATDDDDNGVEMSSYYLVRVLRSIDALWLAAEELCDKKGSRNQIPSWIVFWLDKRPKHLDLDLSDGAAPLGNNSPADILPFTQKPKLQIAVDPSAAMTA